MATKTDWEARALEYNCRPPHTASGICYDCVLDLLREFAEEAAGIALEHDTTEPHTHSSPCHEVIWSEILSLLPPKKED